MSPHKEEQDTHLTPVITAQLGMQRTGSHWPPAWRGVLGAESQKEQSIVFLRRGKFVTQQPMSSGSSFIETFLKPQENEIILFN